MGKLCQSVLLITVTFTIILVAISYEALTENHPVPQIEDESWGPSSLRNGPEDTKVYPFKINIGPNVLSDLKARLERELEVNSSPSSTPRLPPPLEGIGFEYGFNSKFLQVIGKYWLQKYNWNERQKLLNQYPHFKTKIGGLNIHFQHIKPKNSKKPTRAIISVHGWPGSFVEFQKIIPLLTDPKSSKYNYELIIPSLPGFGFSDTAARPGMSVPEMANIFKILMARLGHTKYYVTGGDWGSEVITDMATLYPDNVIAAHSNLCHATTVISQIKYFLATLFPSLLMTEKEFGNPAIRPFSEYLSFAIRETGYFHIQATKPDTIGVGLTHSPLGLAAYILEKFSGATNRSWIDREDGGLLEKFTMDELLDNIMVYWVTGSISSAGRLYREQMDPYKKHHLDRVTTDVPFSCQYLPEEIFVLPTYSLNCKYTNIQSYSIENRGGHFGAMEEPELVADNIISFFDKF